MELQNQNSLFFRTLAQNLQMTGLGSSSIMKAKLFGVTSVLLTSAVLMFAAVRTDYDHKASFSKYHTYSWVGVRAGTSIWQDRITSAVDSALTAKGWQKVPSGGDAAVSAFGQTTERDTLETYYNGFPGWGWRAAWWSGGMATSTTRVIPERVGNLTVDIFDGSTKQLIFRGEASETLSSKPERNDKKLEDAVEDMFKKFPPDKG